MTSPTNSSPDARLALEVLRRELDPTWPSGAWRWSFLAGLDDDGVFELLADTELREIVAGLEGAYRGDTKVFLRTCRRLGRARGPEEIADLRLRKQRLRGFLTVNRPSVSDTVLALDLIADGADREGVLVMVALRRRDR